MRIYDVATCNSGMLAFALVCVTGSAVGAQWLSLPLPGTPRNADKTANLNAPTPRTADGTPDLSGIWRADHPRYNENLLADGNVAANTGETILQLSLQIVRETVANSGINPPDIVAPLDLLISVGDGVKQLLIPAEGDE